MIITGDISDLTKIPLRGLATLSTDDIFCENVKGGYNSSVMVFQAGKL